MKLLKLLLVITSLLLEVLYYLITFPVTLPLFIYKRNRNKKWRADIKIGDKCYFINMADEKSYGVVQDLSEDKLKARLEIKYHGSTMSNWYEIERLNII
jgi:hypothetical protein